MAIIIVYTLWADIGYNVILFTAGLEAIPHELEEAAIVDGAGPLTRLLRVRLPLMKRSFAFVAIMTMADYFQTFVQFSVLVPDGGRNHAVMVLTNLIYRTSFKSFDMGYAAAISAALFVQWFLNSIFVTALTTISVIFTSTLVGFVFAKYDFRFKQPLFYLLIATMMVPAQVTMVPRFLIIQDIGLFNTIWALIVPGLVGAFSIFLARQFIEDIPDSLCEAARLDGAGPLGIYWHVVLPNIKSAIGAIGIFSAMAHWNDYLNPLLMLNDVERMTMPLGLVYFDNGHTTDLAATMAAAALMMLPMIVIFLIFQRQFIRSLTMSGMK